MVIECQPALSGSSLRDRELLPFEMTKHCCYKSKLSFIVIYLHNFCFQNQENV